MYTHLKTAGIRYLINRVNTYPISSNNKQAEIDRINTKNTKYHPNLINSNPKKTQKTSHGTPHSKQWATFSYFEPQTRKITNLFKNTEIQVAFKTCSTLWKHLKPPIPKRNMLKTGI
jgi:hypothetical protein